MAHDDLSTLVIHPPALDHVLLKSLVSSSRILAIIFSSASNSSGSDSLLMLFLREILSIRLSTGVPSEQSMSVSHIFEELFVSQRVMEVLLPSLTRDSIWVARAPVIQVKANK